MKDKVDYYKKSIALHKKLNGKLKIELKTPIKNKDDLSIAYSPGVAAPCLAIKKNPQEAKNLVASKKTIAVISNGSAVLGLGNIGAEASLPVIEGKSALFKRFANLDSIPIAVSSQNVDEFINVVKNIAPTFGGINLEDIKAPECFIIEQKLKEELNIPVFHDDQHGTAIVVLAGIINALKIVKKKKEQIKVIVNGVGSAGVAIIKLLNLYGIKNIICCDSRGGVCEQRKDLNETKKKLLPILNRKESCGSLEELISNCDVFIGVSKRDILNKKMIKLMKENPIIFALANPYPEIMPEIAKKYGAKIVATGRSDFPNQINNVLVFPGIFKGALENNVSQITDNHKIKAAESLARLVKKPNANKIIPQPFQKGIADLIAKSIK